jgi:hypothetical protein
MSILGRVAMFLPCWIAFQTTAGQTVAPPVPALSDRDAVISMSRPPLIYNLSLPASARFTTSDAVFDVLAGENHAYLRIPADQGNVPSDSIHAAVIARGRAWLEQLRATAPDAIHLDDAGRLAVAAGEDSIARDYIAQRLATARLSAADRAYTLLMGVMGFADTAKPARLVVAEEYANALDGLTTDTSRIFAYRAHWKMAEAYDDLAQPTDALRHALRAFSAVGRMPFQDRDLVYKDFSLYLIAAHALQTDADGRRRLDSLTMALREATFPQHVSANDSSYLWMGAWWRDTLTRMAGSGRLLGAEAPPIRAHLWWNGTTAGSHQTDDTVASAGVTSLADGTVRLVLFANIYCCIDAILALRRVHAQLPKGATAMVVTATTGYMNGVLLPPSEEVKRLRTVYLDSLHLTMPIAVWVGSKEATPGGGMVPAASPNLEAFSVAHGKYGAQGEWSSPYAVLVDGRGIVRHVFGAQRGFRRVDEQRALTLVRTFLSRP